MDIQQMMMEAQRAQEEDMKRKMLAFMLNSAMPGAISPISAQGVSTQAPMMPPQMSNPINRGFEQGMGISPRQGMSMPGQPGVNQQTLNDDQIRLVIMKLLSMFSR